MPRRPLFFIFSLVGLVATTASVATAQAAGTTPNTARVRNRRRRDVRLRRCLDHADHSACVSISRRVLHERRLAVVHRARRVPLVLEGRGLRRNLRLQPRGGRPLSPPATRRSLPGQSRVRDVRSAVHRRHGRLGSGRRRQRVLGRRGIRHQDPVAGQPSRGGSRRTAATASTTRLSASGCSPGCRSSRNRRALRARRLRASDART